MNLDVRRALWRDKVLSERGPGKVQDNCPICYGAGTFPNPDTSCWHCFPEDHAPYRYLFPRTPDPEKAQLREFALADEVRADDERSYREAVR